MAANISAFCQLTNDDPLETANCNNIFIGVTK